MLVYRVLSSPAAFERVVDLEILVWKMISRDAVPASMLRAIEHGGGLINGAFMGDDLVGMGMMYPVPLDGRLILWSHMAGVHPDHQGSGIGTGIKWHQRRWALEQGYDEIRWTFDPLQRGNAHFNLRKLGATFDTYLVNFYGMMTDGINNGMPSDRVEAVWRLNDARVTALAAGQPVEQPAPDAPPALLTRDAHGLPRHDVPSDSPYWRIEIPPTLQGHAESVLAWRLALREALQSAFASGYVAYDFDPHNSAYILHKHIP